MVSLELAAAYFIGIHLFVSGSRLRDVLVARLGEQAFLGLFSLLSLIGIVWLVQAYRAAPSISLWMTPLSFRAVVLVAVFLSVLFVVIGLATRSPTATGGESALDEAEPATGILRITRHPFLMGVALWALAHLIASGEAAGVVLFGTMLILGVLGPILIDRKRLRRYGARWESFAAVTSVVPFVAIAQGRNRLALGEIGLMKPLVACIVFGSLLASHAWLFGVSPLAF